MTAEPIRLATRGSALALAQAVSVADTIEAHHRTVDIVEIESTGDRLDDELIHRLGTTGAFVRTLDHEVLEGTVDAAVHSMKDMPTEQPDELVTAAVLPRGPAHDVLVSPEGLDLASVPAGSVVGTGSLRRQAQVLSRRPDLSVAPIRGNVDTRLEKLYAAALDRNDDIDGPESILEGARERTVDTPFDGLVLAEVGLERSDLLDAVPTTRLEEAVPAAGQGAIAVTARDGDLAEWLQSSIDDPRTRVETTVERIVLGELGGGCVAPIGVHAIIQGEHVHTEVQVLDRTGETSIDLVRDLPVDRYADEARKVVDELVDRGARELVEEAKRDEPGPHHRGEDDA